MSFQVLSDIHLEFTKKKVNLPIRQADNLILAGDITTPASISKFDQLLKHCSEKWDNVYYICGNHEFYYGGDINTIKEKYSEICGKYENVHFLDSSYVVIDGICLYGFIAWTPLDRYIVEDGWQDLCDFEAIKVGTSQLTPKMMIKMSKEELSKFDEFIGKVNSEEILCNSVIVISHFPPVRSGTSDPQYRGSDLQPYFTWNDIMRTRACSKIKVWVSGHTHWSYDFTLRDIRYFANQIGYPSEHVKHDSGVFSIV